MSLTADMLTAVDAKLAYAVRAFTATGTIASYNGPNDVLVTFDGDTQAVPAKMFGGVYAVEGDRVGCVKFGTWWTIVGSYTPIVVPPVDLVTFASGTLSSSASSIVLNNIPQTATHLRMYVQGRNTNTGTGDTDLRVRLNNDSGTNYMRYGLEMSNSSTVTGIFTGTATDYVICDLPNNGNPSGQVGQGIVDFPWYTTATQHMIVAHGVSAGTNNQMRIEVGRLAGAQDPVTRIDIIPASGSMTSGTTYLLYGLV